MTSVFQVRSEADYGTSITKYSASEWDQETKMLYLMSRAPDKYEDTYKDTDLWNAFIESKNVDVDASIEVKAVAVAAELVSRIVDEPMIERITDEIIKQINDNPDRDFSSVRIAVPYPLDPSATNNTFAPALSAAVTVGVEERLNQKLQEVGMNMPLDVISDLDPQKSSREDSILNVVNNQRGNTSNPEPGEELEMYMQRLVRQPIFSGNVDKDAIYVPVDDFLVSQSTVAGLINYIQTNGSVTTPPVTGFVLFNGTEVMTPQQETLDYLNTAIDSKKHEVNHAGGRGEFEDSINSVLGSAGLKVDFADVEKTTLSNMELMFLAGFFANKDNQKHEDAFEKALEAVGGSLEEAKGNSASDIFNTPPGNVKQLDKIFEEALDQRIMMGDKKSTRFVDLIKTEQVVDYRGAAL